jgi:hypothetical protein
MTGEMAELTVTTASMADGLPEEQHNRLISRDKEFARIIERTKRQSTEQGRIY